VVRRRVPDVSHRQTALLAAASVLILSACAPIMPPPVPASPVPSLEMPASPTPLLGAAVESPSPGGVWSEMTPVAEEDLAGLRAIGLLVPVRGAVLAKIEDSFDAPRDGGRRHDAVDILAPRGTPILAASEGYVLRVGSNALGGNVIWTSDPEQRFVHYYAHLDRYAKGIRAGDKIMRGTLLGYVGTTGNSPADVPHLHFQVMRVTDAKKWWNGTPVNPFPFLLEPAAAAAASTVKTP
jgi:murein DD-endopeptidase MepM/ murein hydrolase activator NlpD